MNAAILTEYAELILDIRSREDDTKALKEKAAMLEQTVLVELENAGLQNVKLANGVTVFMKETVFAVTPAGKDVAVSALLKTSGDPERDYSDLVTETVNTNSLSALVRELYNDPDKGLPEEWNGIIEVGTKTNAGVRK